MKFVASVEQLRPILYWIREQISEMGFDRSTLHKIELASEEVIINIIHHAYQDRPEPLEVFVKTFGEEKRVEIIFKDDGPPFNPLAAKQVDISEGLEDREVGGLGIYFIRQLIDHVEYTRERDQNILKLGITHSSQKK